VALVISMICHGAAIAWAVRDGDLLARPRHRADGPATPPPPLLDPPDREVEPISVVLLEAALAVADAAVELDRPREVSRSTRPRGEVRDPGRVDEPAISVGASSTEAASGERPQGEPTRSRWLTMRRPEEPGLALSSEFVDDFLARSKPLAPPPDIPFERLTGEIADLRGRLRRAWARGDGQAEGLLAEIVAKRAELAAEELKPAGRGTYAADKETFTAKVGADGSVELKDKPSKLDWQDRMMLMKGVDPYARNKLALLDRTRDQRVALGERHRRVQLGRATALMLRNVDRLWAMTTDLAARKAGLFELWDDCAETGSEEIVAAGAAARLFVLGVIRGRLRGDDAYTAEELAQLNARRRSTAVFDPYE
jgi:hypothetical protein